MEEKKLVSIKETAWAVSLSTRTIDNLVKRDQIPSIKCGRRRLFDIEEVTAALKQGNASPENGNPKATA